MVVVLTHMKAIFIQRHGTCCEPLF